MVVNGGSACGAVDERAAGKADGDVADGAPGLFDFDSVTPGTAAGEVGLDVHLIIAEAGTASGHLKEDGGVVGVGVELGVEGVGVGNGYVESGEGGTVVNGSGEVILRRAFEIAAYAEGNFAFAVKEEEARGVGVGEVEVGGVVDDGEEVVGLVFIAGDDYGPFGDEQEGVGGLPGVGEEGGGEQKGREGDFLHKRS